MVRNLQAALLPAGSWMLATHQQQRGRRQQQVAREPAAPKTPKAALRWLPPARSSVARPCCSQPLSAADEMRVQIRLVRSRLLSTTARCGAMYTECAQCVCCHSGVPASSAGADLRGVTPPPRSLDGRASCTPMLPGAEPVYLLYY